MKTAGESCFISQGKLFTYGTVMFYGRLLLIFDLETGTLLSKYHAEYWSSYAATNNVVPPVLLNPSTLLMVDMSGGRLICLDCSEEKMDPKGTRTIAWDIRPQYTMMSMFLKHYSKNIAK